ALKALEATLTAEATRLEKLGPTAPPVAGPPLAAAGTAAAPPAAAAPREAPAGHCDVALTKGDASLKPGDSGPSLDRLDDATAAPVFVCMKEKQIGAILAAMKPDRAVSLTHALGGGAAETTSHP